MPIDTLFPMMQRTKHDCAIACLGALLPVPYSDIQCAADAVTKTTRFRQRPWRRSGLYTSEIAKLAGRWAESVKVHRQPALARFANATGILSVGQGSPVRRSHSVVAFAGTVWEPTEGIVLKRSTFLNALKATGGRVLDFIEIK